ncbi:MAG: glycoside hydrolase family 6 protein [Anaerolineales bacterium]|nr:glycoside hydrolase family 6 protein [Anaerolineales bacterium]
MSRTMKTSSLFLTLLTITVLIAGMFLPTQTVQAISTPWLSVSGRYIKDPQGNNVVLRGVSLVDIGEVNLGRTRNAVQLINMATNESDGWYARVVRLPVYPNAIDSSPGWLANPDAYFNNHLNPAIQNCVARQIYCIIDWHYISDYNNSTVDTATRAFWNYVAPRYANTPNVIFELYNEPVNPDNWTTWKQWAQPWVDIIRSHAPNNLILIGGPRWSQNLSSAASSPFVGNNLVYVAHIYPEHGGQSNWDSWFGNAANSVPFFVTEWGWIQGGATPTSGTLSGYGIPFSNYMESKGLSWTAWVFDQYWDPKMWDENWNLLGGENYMGEYTKQLLFDKRNNGLPGSGTSTNTPVPASLTASRTNTPPGPTNTAVSGGAIKVQLSGSGTDNNQQSGFNLRVRNTGASAVSNISMRVYFTLDGSQAASTYVLEKYYDQSSAATISGPTQLSGSTYYFTVNYGTASLAAGAAWDFNTALHLNNWASNYSSSNDWWRSTGTLPTSYTDWSNIPAYVSGTRIWGVEPGGSTSTNTPVPATATKTNTPVGPTATKTNTPIGPTATRTNTSVPPTATSSGSGICSVTYTKSNDWGTGFGANVTINNTGSSAINGWTLTWTFGGNQTITNLWNGAYTQSGASVSVKDLGYNGNIPVGGNTSFGFNANYTGTNANPTNFAVNGSSCGGGGGPTNTPISPTVTPSRTNTPIGPTATPSRTNTPIPPTNTPGGPTNTPTFTPTASVTPTNPPAGTHLANPFVGATFYKNVDYVASVTAAGNTVGGTLGAKMKQVANYPTFVWLDSIDAVNGTNGYARSLASHLDQALAQGANAIGIVVYDLPNRDCSALASNGELLIANNGLNRYKTEYIDAIYATVSQAKYANLRIVMVIEPDSLPNLITNLSFAKCSEAQSTGAYVQGVQYAIGKLRSISNTYAYIDVAHAAWLGWDSNFTPFVNLIKDMGAGISGGNSKVDGFISNTANYNPVDEPFMDANTQVGGQPVRSLQSWYDWNIYIDELPYLAALKTALTTGANAYPSDIGMLIDTSRNGWGGPNRPTAASTSTDLKTFVMATRVDKRNHKGNWCNQSGAGIGERPTVNPVAGIEAYVWVKPPGESDGSSSLIPIGPDNPGGKGFDRMCDPTYTGNTLNGNTLTNALPNAPVSGRWFEAQFEELVANAYPPFP